MGWQAWSVVPVWLATLAASVIIALVSPVGERIEWIAITLAAALIATFTIQLAIRRSEGFVVRVTSSVGGAMAILAIATGLLALGPGPVGVA